MKIYLFHVDKKLRIGYYINIMNMKFSLFTDIIKLNKSKSLEDGCVVAVGGFDGVHIGHRVLINALVEEAKARSLPAAVFTFCTDDNPKGDAKLLALREKKMELLASLGVDFVAEAPFSEICGVDAEDFAKEFLFKGLGAKIIVCGYDFRFGKGRKGDVELIERVLGGEGVRVSTPPALLSRCVPVSSTAIRKLITEGDVKNANSLLGRCFSFKAPVVHGAQLGRTIGFPTTNQRYPERLAILKYGVYAVFCDFGGKRYGGIANVGIKPTVGGKDVLCETFIFDFNGDCYGENIEISFVEFIREETKFSSLEELKQQISLDKNIALDILSKEYIL